MYLWQLTVYGLDSYMCQCFGCSVGEKVFQGEDLVLVVHQGEKEMYTESGNLVFVAPGVWYIAQLHKYITYESYAAKQR